MEKLDYKYIAELVRRAQQGNSNAFAELFAATYQSQYRYAVRNLGDETLARDALQTTYVAVLTDLPKLQNPDLFIAWVNRINFRICYNVLKEKRGNVEQPDDNTGKHEEIPSVDRPEDETVWIESKHYMLNQIMNLPLTESQVVLMRYYQHMSVREIGKLLDISRSMVKRYIKLGKAHLRKLLRDTGSQEVAG